MSNDTTNSSSTIATTLSSGTEYEYGGGTGGPYDTIQQLASVEDEGGDGGHGDESFRVLYQSIVFLSMLYVAGDLICGKILKIVPSLVGQIGIGIVFGPYGLGVFDNNDVVFWSTLGKIGLILLLCQAGIEMDFTLLQNFGMRSFIAAFIGLLLPIGIGITLCYTVLGLEIDSAIAAGSSFGPTSAGISLNVLYQCNMLHSQVGQFIVAVAIVDDIYALVVLSCLAGLTGTATVSSIVIPIASAFLWLFVGSAVSLYVMPHVFLRAETMERKVLRMILSLAGGGNNNTTNKTTTKRTKETAAAHGETAHSTAPGGVGENSHGSSTSDDNIIDNKNNNNDDDKTKTTSTDNKAEDEDDPVADVDDDYGKSGSPSKPNPSPKNPNETGVNNNNNNAAMATATENDENYEETSAIIQVHHIIIVLLALLPACHYSKVSFFLGAFLAGLCGCQLSSEVDKQFSNHLGKPNDWLLRIFFGATIGMEIPVHLMFTDSTVVLHGLLLVLSLTGKIITGPMFTPHTIGTSIPIETRTKWDKYHRRDGLIVGISMAAEAEFAFIIARFGYDNVLFDERVYASITFAILCSIIVAPITLRCMLSFYNIDDLLITNHTNPGITIIGNHSDINNKKEQSKQSSQKGGDEETGRNGGDVEMTKIGTTTDHNPVRKDSDLEPLLLSNYVDDHHDELEWSGRSSNGGEKEISPSARKRRSISHKVNVDKMIHTTKSIPGGSTTMSFRG